jgi:hypothetical protein
LVWQVARLVACQQRVHCNCGVLWQLLVFWQQLRRRLLWQQLRRPVVWEALLDQGHQLGQQVLWQHTRRRLCRLRERHSCCWGRMLLLLRPRLCR